MLRVVLTGPECTGKTTLTERISHHYGIPFVPEFAVEYLESRKNKKKKYTLKDLLKIASGQTSSENFGLETAALTGEKIKLCDTDMLTIKIWAEVVFGKTDEIIESWINTIAEYKKNENIYLLCSPEGIPWIAHPLRENPNDRHVLFELYENLLKKLGLNYYILKGDMDARFNEAKKIIEKNILSN